MYFFVLLQYLSNTGYPLSTIKGDQFTVDRDSGGIIAEIRFERGPLARFGNTNIEGLKKTKKIDLGKHISWKKGDIFEERKLKDLEKGLLKSNLFDSITISYSNRLDHNGQLPINVLVSESKHKNLSVGFSYATTDGIGASFSWNNENLFYKGHKCNFDFIWGQVFSYTNISYAAPNIFGSENKLRVTCEANLQNIPIYDAQKYFIYPRISNLSDNGRLFRSVGLRAEYIKIYNSIADGYFMLASLPLYLKYSTLQSEDGLAVEYNLKLYHNISRSKLRFASQTITAIKLIPFIPQKVTLGLKAIWHTILGPDITQIPLTHRIFLGSDDNMRGYRFHFLSPLDEQNNRIGAKSAIVAIVESRFKVNETIGFVLFFDCSTLSIKSHPNFQNWYRSIGIGLRYFLPFSPIRLDVGFPLNRQVNSPGYRIYLNIGQSF